MLYEGWATRQAFPQGNFRLLYSTLLGVVCPPTPPGAKHRALPPAVPTMPTETPDASKPPRTARWLGKLRVDLPHIAYKKPRIVCSTHVKDKYEQEPHRKQH